MNIEGVEYYVMKDLNDNLIIKFTFNNIVF